MILIASPKSQPQELEFFKQDLGINANFCFCENLETARLMLYTMQAVVPVNNFNHARSNTSATVRVLTLTKGGEPIMRTYCLQWKKTNDSPLCRELAEKFKELLAHTDCGPLVRKY